MCYHVSKDWLQANGMNPEKAGCVELANCKNFLSWTQQQPWMVLHELAHGYHDQVLGFDHAGVKACLRCGQGVQNLRVRPAHRRQQAKALCPDQRNRILRRDDRSLFRD